MIFHLKPIAINSGNPHLRYSQHCTRQSSPAGLYRNSKQIKSMENQSKGDFNVHRTHNCMINPRNIWYYLASNMKIHPGGI